MEVKPMDGRKHTIAVRNLFLSLALVSLLPAGCKSTKSEVPPGKPYQTTGSPPSVGFSSDAHPSTAGGMAGLYGNKGPGSFAQDVQNSATTSRDITYGMPAPGATNLGAPTANLYGRPGTAGTSDSSPSGSASLADSMLRSVPPASKMLQKDPEAMPASSAAPASANAFP
jgi:hypothetical protein